jgi:alpha-amylase
MLGGGGNPSAWLEVDGARTSHDSPRAATAQTQLAQGNDYIGIAITSEVSPAATLWCAPVETISNSEAGFERVYQGAGLLLGWPLSLAGGASQTVTVRHAVATARDHAEEERGQLIPTG